MARSARLEPADVERPERSYTEEEKLAGVVLAVESGVRSAADTLGFPERTIYGWLEHNGGLARIRAVTKARIEHAAANAGIAVAQSIEAKAKLNSLPDKEALSLVQHILAPPPSTTRTEAPAQAAAFIQVTVPGIAGAKPETIQVPRDRPALPEGEHSAPDGTPGESVDAPLPPASAS